MANKISLTAALVLSAFLFLVASLPAAPGKF
jgi:hypothetical protein